MKLNINVLYGAVALVLSFMGWLMVVENITDTNIPIEHRETTALDSLIEVSKQRMIGVDGERVFQNTVANTHQYVDRIEDRAEMLADSTRNLMNTVQAISIRNERLKSENARIQIALTNVKPETVHVTKNIAPDFYRCTLGRFTRGDCVAVKDSTSQ